ncbi:hypothetical protein G3T14_21405 [Methylobacterium sp. BTF04]|uniref:hypothetical protein n=1 Tax=Methylobacterium sp. BTF04 TaxID=2708300 RepID=UPI0013D6BC80|nr:hypothetical protein [Methylobacterium sp. BTF04]NEU14644.1 hypothetical protein [Methylobacterium sp. BTF04]
MNAHRTVRPSDLSEEIKLKIADQWREGHHSAEIAIVLKLRERAVCKVLAEQQDARHAVRQREARSA